MLAYFGPAKSLQDIGLGELTQYVTWSRQQTVSVPIGGPKKRAAGSGPMARKETGRLRSPSTIVRHLATLRAVMNMAYKTIAPGTRQRLLDIVPEFPDVRTPDHTPRPWSLEDLRAVRDAAAAHVAEAMTLAVLTGMRKTSVLSLTRADVDLRRGVIHKGVHNKAQRDGDIPIPPDALPYVARLVRQAEDRGVEQLISYRRRGKDTPWQPVQDIKIGFNAAKKRAGIPASRRFHALKTTAITLASEAGADVHTLQMIGDHADARTTQRHYVGEAATRRKETMEKVGAGLSNAGLLPDETVGWTRGKKLLAATPAIDVEG